MYILELYQEGMSTEVGVFETVEEGREFISKLKGYTLEEIDGFTYETIDIKSIPDYLELEHNNNIVPITKFMFTEDGDIEIYWKEISNLSDEGTGMVEGATLVDAYAIENSDLKKYIESRERNFNAVKKFLEEKNYEVTRAYFGSEDGEAILYKKKGTDDWHFLTHMDPNFSEAEDLNEYFEMI